MSLRDLLSTSCRSQRWSTIYPSEVATTQLTVQNADSSKYMTINGTNLTTTNLPIAINSGSSTSSIDKLSVSTTLTAPSYTMAAPIIGSLYSPNTGITGATGVLTTLSWQSADSNIATTGITVGTLPQQNFTIVTPGLYDLNITTQLSRALVGSATVNFSVTNQSKAQTYSVCNFTGGGIAVGPLDVTGNTLLRTSGSHIMRCAVGDLLIAQFTYTQGTDPTAVYAPGANSFFTVTLIQATSS